jgi:hypothetical protein
LPRHGSWNRRIVFAAPLAALAVQIALKLWAPLVYAGLNVEGGVVESLQVVAFAAALAARAACHLRRGGRPGQALVLAVVAGGLAFVVGEEVSWGQRLLGLKAPEFFQWYNVQREVTFHNLIGMSYLSALGYGLVNLWGSVAWLLVPWLRGRARWVTQYVPGRHLSLYFLVAGVTYAWFPLFEHVGHRVLGIAFLHRGVFFDWFDQEPAELLLAVGILLFMIDVGRRRVGLDTPYAEGPLVVRRPRERGARAVRRAPVR